MSTSLRKPSRGKPRQRRPYSTPIAQALRPVSYDDLAQAAGISYGYMTKIARGAKPCSPRVRLILEEFFEQPWWQVLGFDRDPDPRWDGTIDGEWERVLAPKPK